MAWQPFPEHLEESAVQEHLSGAEPPALVS